MNSRSLSSTVFLYRFAGAVLLTAAFASGCGSGASPGGPTGGGGTGGIATSAGGTTGAGGSSTSAGGSTGRGRDYPRGRDLTTTTGWGTPVTGGPTGTGTPATVTVDPSTTVGTIGADFTGFSYEKTHIMNGSFTSNNTNMIALYKLLGSPMVRIGANDVERCTWAGTGTAPSQPNGQPFNYKGHDRRSRPILRLSGRDGKQGHLWRQFPVGQRDCLLSRGGLCHERVSVEHRRNRDRQRARQIWELGRPNNRLREALRTPSSPRQALCWLARPAPAKLT